MQLQTYFQEVMYIIIWMVSAIENVGKIYIYLVQWHNEF